jgi:hypothetical protein
MPDPYNYGVNQIWFENIILTAFALIVIVIFGWAIYTFIRAIIGFIFSHGDTTKINKSLDSIRYMILGLFLSILFLFIFPYFFEKIKVPGYQIYTAQNIFKRAGELFGLLIDGVQEIGNFYDISQSQGISSYKSPSLQISIPNADVSVQDQSVVYELESDYPWFNQNSEL